MIGMLYFVSAGCFVLSSGLAYFFYRDFFAADKHPIEWVSLYTGLFAFAAGFVVRGLAFMGYLSSFMMVNSLLMLLGGCLTLFSGYRLWRKFKL